MPQNSSKTCQKKASKTLTLKKPKFRIAYENYPRHLTPVGEKSLTKTDQAHECEINFIVSKFHKTGQITHLAKQEGAYGDFQDMDFEKAMNMITEAKTMFEELPSSVRAEFDNDPGRFVEFAKDEKNQTQMAEWGLAEYPIPPETSPDAPQSNEVRNPQSDYSTEEKSAGSRAE